MRRLATAFTLILTLLAPLAHAQDAPGPSPGDSGRSDVQLLIDILQDDQARQELIDRLAAGAAPATDPAETAAAAADLSLPEAVSIGRQIAVYTQGAAEGVARVLETTWRALVDAPGQFSGLSGLDMAVVIDAVGEIALTILTTVAVLIVLRRLARPRFRRMGDIADGSGPLKRLGLYLGSAVVDLLIVLVAWAAGYIVSVTLFGPFGEIGIRQTLYLNAFLLVELVKVGLRMIVSPTTPHLRPMPVENRAAWRLNKWGSLIASLVGYGQLLAVPIVNRTVSFTAGRALTALIVVLVVLILAALVVRYRRDVAAWLMGYRGGAGATGWIVRRWHLPALLYLFGILIVVLASPPQFALATLAASGRVLLTILVGVAIGHWLSRIMARGITLPEGWTQRLPLLEERLNRFVPKALYALRALIALVVAAVILDALGLFDLAGWLGSDRGVAATGSIISVCLILLVAFAIFLALTSYVDYRLNPDYGRPPTARETTLFSLLRNAGVIALLIITVMFVLAEIGLNIAPLLASAGVLGLAIGFGAQKLVQDIITGLFIQFENAINLGDVVTAGPVTGSVEKLTVRSVSIRDLQGIYHLVPFSSVDAVSNYTRDFSAYVIDMGVAYREDVPTVKAAMLDAFTELKKDPEQGPFIRGELQWFGVDSFGDSAVVLKSRILTDPAKQWGVGRAYNEIVKRVFDERGIEIPFPYRTLVMGENRDGTARALDVRRVGGPEGGAPAAPSDGSGGATPSQDAPTETGEVDHG